MVTKIFPDKWMTAPETRKVMEALGDAKFVGGCIRNTILDKPIKDIDIATPLVPEEVVRRLDAAGIRHVPTGIQHGTVTAIVEVMDDKPTGYPVSHFMERHGTFEITTLRRDVTTDGRRATVAFTTDWSEDAQRRDFTMNALYADMDGTVLDTVDGFEDVVNRRVRFVGNAMDRIHEDALRILRFFRFHGYYGFGLPDRDGIAACAAGAALIDNLSGERIQAEMMQILLAPEPVDVLTFMGISGVLKRVIGDDLKLMDLHHLTQIEHDNGFAPDALLRLASLLPAPSMTLMQRWRFSNAMKARWIDAGHVVGFDIAGMKKLIYKVGKAAFCDSVLLRWASEPTDSDALRWRGLLHLADTWDPPKFPISGRDLLERGLPQGPHIGWALENLERMWINMNFPEDKETVFKAVDISVMPERPGRVN